jgi:hypothetical protein
MSDEQFDAELLRLRAERDRLKALPAEPDRWEERLTGDLYCDIYQALPVAERGAWLKSHGLVICAMKKQVSVIQGDVRGDSSPRVTTLRSGVKVQPFHVAVNRCPHDGHVWPLVSSPGIHTPSKRLPQPGQSSGECSVILIPERSSPPSFWHRMGAQPWPFLSVSDNRPSGDAGKSPSGNIDLVKPD